MTNYDNPNQNVSTSNDPDALRAEIDQTRANLSQNVNALGEAVTPGNIAKRQTEKVKGAAVGVKDKVMGSAHDTASSVGGSVSGTASGIAGMPGQATSTAKTKAQGNPMAAGLVALGAGWLVGSMLPASERERQAAQSVKEKAQPLLEEAQELGKEAAANLKEPAMEAADSVKTTAQDAAATVKAEGQQQAADVSQSTTESQQRVQEHQARPDTSL
ncbi:DUF3618 domain-containing protein [Nocardioides sp.]|uniref:DUF3618 domain-containing protein n=1 Tax=Nocardioides sp. TaxID=35761 RepID=UPI002CEA9C95|nr:DUF3618 domain-containing protein [Nocardioides sp.]HXH79386.1 DUF3618 domain-containing protein [Nocardioides sp.]